MELDRIFDALASGPRRGMLASLAQTELTTTELAGRFAMSPPAVSRHLSVLENAGLVASRRDGQRVLYSLVRDTLVDALGEFTAQLSPAAPPRKAREAI
ncbi:MAG: transcriptional regulator [Betaproteobacteria bacterium RIFCSPHIGHO2_12_FULL_69_13]|nr:MAG: transcriptional regulator [Betaproteobacteria bacterium RIFCSPHIGHO2_12_FULL_69_13]OGA68209.1 MAG: transcriptional regulator [Betaproteobacteria bacterium RIFCSPLOWO2_12_FULL_68_20]